MPKLIDTSGDRNYIGAIRHRGSVLFFARNERLAGRAKR
jgi:hypothetical protein